MRLAPRALVWLGDQRVVDDIGRHLCHGVSLHVVVELAHIPSSTGVVTSLFMTLIPVRGLGCSKHKVVAVQKQLTTLLTSPLRHFQAIRPDMLPLSATPSQIAVIDLEVLSLDELDPTSL